MPGDADYANAQKKNVGAARKMADWQSRNVNYMGGDTPTTMGAAAAVAKQVTGGTANDIARINAQRAGADKKTLLGSFKQGGVVGKTGAYKLHKGERVVPVAKAGGTFDALKARLAQGKGDISTLSKAARNNKTSWNKTGKKTFAAAKK